MRGRWLLRLYPRRWRERYGEEMVDLIDELVSAGMTTRARVTLGIAAAAATERARSWRRPRTILVGGAVAVAAAGATLGLVLATRTPVPSTVARTAHSGEASMAAVAVITYLGPGAGSSVIQEAYVPAKDIETPQADTPMRPLQRIPVYATDHLKVLIGHLYPGGVGFVPLGKTVASTPCETSVTTVESGRTSALLCGSQEVVVPDVVRSSTPSAAGQLSGLGLTPNVVSVHSTSVPAGHVVSTSPSAGSMVPGRSLVTLRSSLGPGR